MSQNQNEHDPAGPPEVYRSVTKGAEVGHTATKAIGRLPKFLFGLFMLPFSLIIIFTAGWTATLMRTRIGILSLLMKSLCGLFGFGFIAGMHTEPWASTFLQAWLMILLVTVSAHALKAGVRFFNPEIENIHRWDIGVPNQILQPLWRLTMRSWGENPTRVSLIGEPLLLVLIALVVWRLEAVYADRYSGVAVVVLLAALGVFLQTAKSVLKGLWELQLLRDQETEQSAMAEDLSKLQSKGSGREAEGVAQIAPQNRRRW